MTEKHSILGGKVQEYKRPESPIWQYSTYLAKKIAGLEAGMDLGL